ncbi:MAG: exonuclease SbcCD subunit D [Actinomycetota bacterium]
MRILHTSDWHVGRRLGRFDRTAEHLEAVERVAAVAEAEQADLVLHSGDLFDRAMPPVEALRLALEGLVRLAGGGRRPVVVVAGNHDSPELFEALAPFLAAFGIHLVGRIKPPAQGGVLRLETAGGPAVVACFPFLRAVQTVDFMERAQTWYGSYAERVRRLAAAYAEAVSAVRGADGVGLLVAHFLVSGAAVHTGLPRGERELHMGEAYAADPQALPPGFDYVALGHVHAPQAVPGVTVPAQYAGSLLPLDFGEAGEEKRVVLVEARPGVPAVVRSVPLGAGRRLERLEGPWEEIAARPGLDDAYLDLVVDTAGPEPGLLDRARERFPLVVKVAARYRRAEVTAPVVAGRPFADLYADYHRQAHGEDAGPEVLAAFREVEEEVCVAAD